MITDTDRRVRVLVVRLSSIGDIVQCSAVPRHLRRRFPNATIDWVVRSDCLELVASNPYVTKVISFDRKLGLKGWLSLAKKLDQELYTHVYDAHNNIRSHILCWVLRPRHLLRRSKNRFFRFCLHWLKINFFGKIFKGVDSFITPLKAWGITNDLQGPEIFLESEIFLKTMDLFRDPGRKIVALAPATAWPKKTWPLDHWLTLTKEILNKTDFDIVILGGPKDNFCAELVIDKKRVSNLQGKLSLQESAATAKQCNLLIAADTGILHLTEATGRPVLALLGPTFFGHPYLKESVAIQKNLWCQPCSKDGSGICYNPTFQKCMKEIKPDEVFRQFTRITQSGPS